MIHHFARRLILTVSMVVSVTGWAQAQENANANSPRIALVIGIGAYKSAPLPTAANDAGLVAQTLAAAGFDVTGARDLDGAALRRTIHDFLDKASAGGPRGVALVYLAGHALQIEGENYFAPTDADLDRATGAAIETFRIADLTHALAATNLGAKVVIIDGAHAAPDAPGPLSSGLALVEAEQGTLIAFNAAPGAVAPIEPGPFGLYAKLLTQNIKQGGVPIEESFDRLRVGVNTDTGGSVTPWDASKLLQNFTFFDRSAKAPAMGSAQVPFTSLRTRPLRDFSAEQAYDVAVARDTIGSYEDYLTIFSDHPLARRVRQILALRREALFWRDVVRANSAPAYWTYLRRYPNAPHEMEAQRRLVRLAADTAPPPGFAVLAFDVPPPPKDELLFLDRRGIVVMSDLPPPPPPPLFLLPPLPAEADVLQAPPPPPGPRLLPVPIAVAIPFVRPILAPGVIAPPRGINGSYRQPRPFAAAASDGGLVPRTPEVPVPATPIVPMQNLPAPKGPQAPKAPAEPVVASPSEPKLEPLPVKPPSAGTGHALPKPKDAVLPAPASPVTQGAKPMPAPSAPAMTPPPPGPKSPHPDRPKVHPGAPPTKDQGQPQKSPTPGAPPLPTSTMPDGGRPLGPAQHKRPSALPSPLPTLAPAPSKTPPVIVAPRPQEQAPRQKPADGQPARPLPGTRPPAIGEAPHAGAEPHRTRPKCGHPGQPPCHP